VPCGGNGTFWDARRLGCECSHLPAVANATVLITGGIGGIFKVVQQSRCSMLHLVLYCWSHAPGVCQRPSRLLQPQLARAPTGPCRVRYGRAVRRAHRRWGSSTAAPAAREKPCIVRVLGGGELGDEPPQRAVAGAWAASSSDRNVPQLMVRRGPPARDLSRARQTTGLITTTCQAQPARIAASLLPVHIVFSPL
jgi:hypothetical protein